MIACIATACGSAAPYDYGSEEGTSPAEPNPLYSIQATVTRDPTRPTGVVKGERGFAFVWLPVKPGPGKFQVVRAGRVRGDADVRTIDGLEGPPSLLIDGETSSGMKYAQAELVYYEEHSGNHQLDLHEAGEPGTDIILGRAPGVRLWWASGKPGIDDHKGTQPTREGFSVTVGPTSAPDPDECWHRDATEGSKNGRTCPPSPKQATELSSEEAIDVIASSDPILQSYTCRGFWGTTPERTDGWPDYTPGFDRNLLPKLCEGKQCGCQGEACCGGEACPLDLPPAGVTLTTKLHCNEAQTAYSWTACVADPKACGTVFCHYGYGKREEGEKPAGWPVCPPFSAEDSEIVPPNSSNTTP